MVYDAVIVGAGPAGGECGRELAGRKKKVLLIERAASFQENDFSSGGAPLELLKQFDLEAGLAACSWRKISLQASSSKSLWEAEQPQGVVLDFAALRGFLAEEIEKRGGLVQMGWNYLGHRERGGGVAVQLKKSGGEEEQLAWGRVLIDATGAERRVLMGKSYRRSRALLSTGIEWLIEVEQETYLRYEETLSLYLGLKWMPQGYGWVFPMGPNRLKVGVGRYDIHKSYAPYKSSFLFYLEALIREVVRGGPFRTLDRHGKTLAYSYGRRDRHQEGRVIAVGDAVSTVNPLAFEGIRHAMASGRLAAEAVERFLEGREENFDSYEKALTRYCGWKWLLSEQLMRTLYRQRDEKKIDHLVDCFGRLSMQQMIDLCFHYSWREALKLLGPFWFSAP